MQIVIDIPEKVYKSIQDDRTKKSNIKCEHCKYWRKAEDGGHKFVNRICKCETSPKHNFYTYYYNRCKAFGWAEGDRDR